MNIAIFVVQKMVQMSVKRKPKVSLFLDTKKKKGRNLSC
jgi:hypothetical protein